MIQPNNIYIIYGSEEIISLMPATNFNTTTYLDVFYDEPYVRIDRIIRR